MLDGLRNYINDTSWRIKISDHKVNIVNYLDVISLEDNRITVKYQDGMMVITGDRLSVNKLLENEMLITGEVKGIEFK